MNYEMSGPLERKALLHTPEGVRDIYGGECAGKLAVEESLHQILKLYGFQDIETPMFEFFEVFNKERGTVASREMYKFFDRDGNTLVLRPDITPSIARCAAKYYKEEEFPIRLCYMGNTFINHVSYQGKLKEVTQLGAELINDDTSDADAELIAITIECLLKAGLTEFQVEIGHAEFLNGLLEEAGFGEEEAQELKQLIEIKNPFGVEELVSKKELPAALKELFIGLPSLFGNVERILAAKEQTQNARSLSALDRLEKLYHILDGYGFSQYVTFDLGMLSKYNYYTGIIFRAYTYGTGEPVAKGGRYDNLVAQFGKEAPAVGLVIVVDSLMAALERQKLTSPGRHTLTIILYKSEYRREAISLAGQFRGQGMKIGLVRKSSRHSLSEYEDYAARAGAGGILYMENEETITIIDRDQNTRNTVSRTSLTAERTGQ